MPNLGQRKRKCQALAVRRHRGAVDGNGRMPRSVNPDKPLKGFRKEALRVSPLAFCQVLASYRCGNIIRAGPLENESTAKSVSKWLQSFVIPLGIVTSCRWQRHLLGRSGAKHFSPGSQGILCWVLWPAFRPALVNTVTYSYTVR